MYTNPEDAKAAKRRHYEANKELYKARANESRKRQIAANKEYVKNLILNGSCVDCGKTDYRVLQFDHRDAELKVANISQLIASRKKLEIEIAKCDLRCADCHMIRTAEQFGWERLWG